MGTIILGKVESGVISKGQQLLVMPNKVRVSNYRVFFTPRRLPFDSVPDRSLKATPQTGQLDKIFTCRDKKFKNTKTFYT